MGIARGATVEELVFGTRDAAEIDSRIDGFCAASLGARIVEVRLRETSVGIVRGVVLADGRRVLVKVHQPRERPARLAAVHALQDALWRAGFPCPQPLLAATPLGRGMASVEALLTDGEPRDCHDPDARRHIAQALAAQLEILRPLGVPAALHGDWTLFAPDSLWPAQAHAPIFDLAATARGAEWIDAIAARAKRLAVPAGEPLAGHGDWSGKHFRFAAGRITAVYDWDSLTARPETTLVGIAALTFCTRFDLPGVPRAATPEEARAFVAEYAAARGGPLRDTERRRIAAVSTLLAAYSARCEHALGGAAEDPDSFTAALRRHGTDYLRP